MLEFSTNLKLFYKAGKHSFLTKNALIIGQNETFYLHWLRFYLPKNAKETYENLNLGIGFFSMQEFERQNKEYKNSGLVMVYAM